MMSCLSYKNKNAPLVSVTSRQNTESIVFHPSYWEHRRMEETGWNQSKESLWYEVEPVLQEEVSLEKSKNFKWETDLDGGLYWYIEMDGIYW